MDKEYITNLKNEIKVDKKMSEPETKKKNEQTSKIQQNGDDKYLNELNLKIQVDDMLLKSWGAVKPNIKSKPFVPHEMEYFLENPKQLKNKLEIRQNQINEYLQEQTVPIIVDGKSYKFHQVEAPLLSGFIGDQNIEGIQRDLEQINEQMYQNNKELQKLKILEKDYEAQIKNINSEIESIKEPLLDNTINISARKKQNIKKNLLNRTAKYDESIKALNQIKTDITYYEDDINKLLGNKTAYSQDLEDLKSDKLIVSNENIQKIKDYKDELQRLNTGIFNTERLQNESEEDYLNRLILNAQTPVDDSRTSFFAQQQQNNKFMENLKSLIRSESKIDNIINYFKSKNEFDIIYNFNKYFEKFKSDYIDIYGYDNKNVSSDELIRLITIYAQEDEDGELSLTLPKELLKIKDKRIDDLPENLKHLVKEPLKITLQKQDKDNFKFDKLDNGMVKITSRNELDEPISGYFLIYTGKLNKKNVGGQKVERYPPIIFFSDSGKPNTFQEASPQKTHPFFIGKLFAYFGIDTEKLKKIFGIPYKHKLISREDLELIAKKLDLGEFQNDGSFEQEPFLKAPENIEGKNYHIYGWGIHDNIPESINFGDHILLLKKLFQKNILSLQNKKGLKLAGFPNKKVSDEFVMVIMKLSKGDNLTPKDLSILKLGEKELLDNMLYICGLHKKIITGSSNDTVNKTKKELELIEGEIEAGNNNEEMKNKLYKCLFKLVHFSVISEVQARKHYKDIVKDFF